MEFLNPTMQTHSQFSSNITFISPKYPFTTHRIKNSLNPKACLSKLFFYPSFSHKFSRNFRVSAHFGRPSRRKNYLRKKLTQSQHPQLLEQEQQVSHSPTIHHPSSNFDNTVDKIGSDSDSNLQLDSNDSVGNWVGDKEGELDELGSDNVEVLDIESKINNELKSLMDQYNADSEFWGFGSGHIFTVYEDADGKVERVEVDESEILSRNEIDPSLDEVNEAQELKEVTLKIAHAKALAKEMENGSNVLGKNSSVAKFVKSGGGLGFVNTIQKFTLDKPVVLSKWPIIGLTGLFGLVLVVGLSRIFTTKRSEEEDNPFVAKKGKNGNSHVTAKRGKEGYTSMEKEMLRRKMKARMEREKLVKGSVEVMEDFKNSDIDVRPQLDKQGLLNAIVEVTGENVTLGPKLLSDAQNNESMDFDNKIEEIRRMARHARETEKSATVQDRNYEKDDSQSVHDVSNAKEVIDIESTSLDNQIADHTKRPPLDKQDLKNTIDASSLKLPIITPVSESTNFDSENEGIGAKASTMQVSGISEVEEEETVNVFPNEKQVFLKKTTSVDPQIDDATSFGGTPHPQSSTPEVNPVKAKPRIIKSVKEAKEYLSKKRGKREQNQETEVGPGQEIDATANIRSTHGNLGSQRLAETPGSDPKDIPSKIKDTIGMDRNEQEIAEINIRQGSIGVDEDSQSVSDFSNEKGVVEIKSTSLDDAIVVDTERSHLMNTSDSLASKIPSDISTTESVNFDREVKKMTEMASSDEKTARNGSLADDSGSKKEHQAVNGFSNEKIVKNKKSTSLDDPGVGDTRTLGEALRLRSNKPGEDSVRAKPRIIKSVQEAKEFLSQKRGSKEQTQETKVRTSQKVNTNMNKERVGKNGGVTSQQQGKDWSSVFASTTSVPGDNTLKKEKPEMGSSQTKGNKAGDNGGVTNNESSGGTAGDTASANKENWIEKNFHEFEPILKKIGDGFQQNYMVASETVNENTNITPEMLLPRPDEDGELEWMKDDRLREIVFKVRENELTGRDPFHLMDDEDKRMFFEGLDKKVEKVNEELINLHQWVHSNIENLDYGADGISVHDPPEKIVPRWKGPPLNTTPAVLDDYLDQRKALFAEKSSSSNLVERDEQELMQKSQESPAASSSIHKGKMKSNSKDSKTSKTVIEGSDGSVRDGKKSGKEFWEHTRKWSRGFLEIYNAETDPETKAVMKDMGKDLDRWITEKEIQDAADLLKKVPERGQKVIKEKLEKVKREMELYGPHAVVSKYGEYREEKEVDYLWWLDLPVVMCIEICTVEDNGKRTGLYSLEMGAGLDLEPKPYHVIAFEDATDCHNYRYIIQSQMDMLGSGEAFVVAHYPKDAYRDAKANGFNVTVIRKGELKLNVDQTLEEVEELVTDIGTKMYHDQITRGRSIDMDSLMKGVFGVNKPTRRRRAKRKLKKPKK